MTLAVTGVVPALPVAAQATPAMDTDPEFPADDQVLLHTIVESAMAETATPGALVSVRYPGRGVWRHAAGISDIERGTPVTLDDHVRIASNTKTFVATVILQLAEEGALTLDDSLETYLPGIPNGSTITLRQILGMRAGIFDYINDPLIAETYVEDPVLEFSPEDALDIIRAGTPVFAPDERVEYSNSNYILLGMIAEQLTGRTIGEEVQDRILAPLGMTHTTFPVGTPEMPQPVMRGYLGEEPGDLLRDVTQSNPDVPWAAGAMISTLSDLETWTEALGTGTLLAPETQAARLAFQPVQEGPVSLGYGLGILDLNGFVGHNGGILGYSSWAMYEPESGTTIVVVTNRAGTLGGTADQIFLNIALALFPEKFPGLAGE